MQRTLLSLSSIIVLAGILMVANALGSQWFRNVYYDLTDEKLYTLTSGSKNILSSLEDPITLRFYFSNTDSASFPAVKIYGNRILDFLREYERAGKGKIKLEVHDPRLDSEEEEWAQKYGLTPMQLPNGERLFVGLAAVNGLGDEASIPFFNLTRQEFLEYDVTKLIYTLMNNKKPRVGLISSLAIKGEEINPMMQMHGQQPESQPWFFVEQLRELYQLEFLEGETSTIDESISVLVVMHPKELSEKTLYAIDQFVMRGGNLIVMTDPFSQSDSPPAGMQDPMQMASFDRSSHLNQLLKSWGIEQIEAKAIFDEKLATQVATAAGVAQEFPLWISVTKDNMNQNDIATGSLSSMLFPWAGAFTLHDREGVETEALIETSNRARLIEEKDYKFGGGDPANLARSLFPANEQFALAVRARGAFKSNYAENLPAGADQVSHLTESIAPATVVAIADVDFANDRFAVSVSNFFGRRMATLRNDNLVFFLNMIENLSGTDDLISIRSRGQFSRPFTRVQDIERNAANRWKQEEAVLQAKLNQANQRLRQLQASVGDNESQVFDKALLDELKRFREERLDAQRKLREVNRNLRLDKERLGNQLFMANTFLIPIILILGSVFYYSFKRRLRRGGNRK